MGGMLVYNNSLSPTHEGKVKVVDNNLGFLLEVKGPVHPKHHVWIRLAIEITG